MMTQRGPTRSLDPFNQGDEGGRGEKHSPELAERVDTIERSLGVEVEVRLGAAASAELDPARIPLA